MTPTPTDRAFENLALEFLAEHAEVRYERRQIKQWLGSRTDLICGVGQSNEVFASYNRGGQIAVGATATGSHTDFEDWGRGLSDAEIAREAFDCLVELLKEFGHLDRTASM